MFRGLSASIRLPDLWRFVHNDLQCRNIDDQLIEEARRIGHHKTKKEAVTTALSE